MASSLRITIVQGAFLPVPPLLGGAVEKVWVALGQQFARDGHQVTHISRRHADLPEDETVADVHYLRVRGANTPRSLWQLKAIDLLYTLRARRVLPPADILVTNTFWMPIVERRTSRGRTYVHVARYPKGQMRWYPERAVLQTVSEPIRRALLRELPSAQSRIRVVPYPLAPGYLVPLGTPKQVILYTGRLHPEKGVHVLIDAFARLLSEGLTGWTLRIIGPWKTAHGGGGTEYRRQLANAAAKAGGAIELLEPIFGEAPLVKQYSEAAIFAYPSLAEFGETFGLAVLEAMAAGCAPVVSALGCFADFIDDGKNGIVFNHRAADPAGELAKALSIVIHSPTQREAFRRAAWDTARNYTLPTIADRFITDFHSFLETSTPLAASSPACLSR